jgi:hypothetical protein
VGEGTDDVIEYNCHKISFQQGLCWPDGRRNNHLWSLNYLLLQRPPGKFCKSINQNFAQMETDLSSFKAINE